MEALLRKAIRTLMHELADALARGECNNWDDYLKITGKIEGLAIAERMLLDIIESRGDDPDDSKPV